MRPNFLSRPALWTRAARQHIDPVRYASPIETFVDKGHRVTTWFCVVALVSFLVLLFAGKL
jgi:hypothetical protein